MGFHNVSHTSEKLRQEMKEMKKTFSTQNWNVLYSSTSSYAMLSIELK